MAENGNGSIKLSAQVAMQLIAWIVGLVLVYGAVNVRVSVLEDQYRRTQQDISEIKANVRSLLERP
jgi:hypothetical protein